MPETLIADIDLSDPVEAINALVGPHFPLESILKTNVSSWNLQFLICVFRRGFRPTDEELYALEREFNRWLKLALTRDDLDELAKYNLKRLVRTSSVSRIPTHRLWLCQQLRFFRSSAHSEGRGDAP